MAKKHFDSEKLELNDLEAVVAGAALGATDKDDETQKKTAIIDNLGEANETKPMLTKPSILPGPTPTGGGFIMDNGTMPIVKPAGDGFIPQKETVGPWAALAETSERMKSDLSAELGRGKSPEEVKASMEVLVTQHALKLQTDLKVDNEQATALAWSSLYKAAYDEGPMAGPVSFQGLDAARASVIEHVEQVTKGLAAEIGINGDLKASLSRSSDVIAQALVGASETTAEAIKTQAVSAFEKGLDLAKETGIGKSVLATIDDPRNVDNWKQMLANTAWAVESPGWVTPTKFLLEQMTSQAVAKAVGLSDFPSEMKQTARAMVTTLDNLEKAFVDIYSSGFLAGMTMGLDVKGIINIGSNMADMGKAIWAGDAGALGKAAEALVTDMFNDIKDGLKSYYVDAPSKAFEWTKTITMDLLDELGATKYAEIAVAETKQAFVDFGNMARDGCVGAVDTVADFAKNDVVGAFNTVESLAREGVDGAMNALEDVAKDGLKAATSVIGELAKLGDSKAMESMTRLIVFGVPGALAEITGAAKQIDHAAWVLRAAAEQGSQAALNAVSDFARDTSSQFQRVFVDGVQQAIIHEVPGALNKMIGLVDAGVPFARDSAQALLSAGGTGANALYNELQGLYGKAGEATAVVEWAAKYAYNDIGKAAFNEIERVANTGGQYATAALNGLGDVAKTGGRYAEDAVDALKSLAQHSEVARDALKKVWDKLNPANWWPW